MIIDDSLKAIIESDLQRCKDAEKSAEGTHKLFQALISKYNGIFENFKGEIEVTGKMSVGGPFDYRPELNAIREKLEVLLAVNESKKREKDPLCNFKKQFFEDIEELDRIIKSENEIEMKEEYNKLIARYSKVIPDFSNSMDGYDIKYEYFFDVSGESLKKNLKSIYEKMNICSNLNFVNIKYKNDKEGPLLQITNNNQNSMEVNLTFEQLKEKAESITSVSDEEVDEILEKINEIEEICNSSERKTKKWEKIKKIIVWLMDKGIDVAIQLIPSIINKLK